MGSGLQVKSERRGDVLLIALRGDAGMATIDVLQRELSQACEGRPTLAVLDMSGMTFISSIGMGALVSFQRGIETCGGRVRIAALQPLLAEAFRRARLNDVFELHDTVASATGETTPTAKKKPANK